MSRSQKGPGEPRLSKGIKLLDRYEIVERIGAGGMGEVYRAADGRLGRDVAIKVLSAANLSNQEMHDRFDREIRSVAALSHPNVVALHDIADHHDIRFAVMELVTGKTLRELVAEGLDWQRTVELGHDVACGLSAAHSRNIMHRDIKPENVIVSAEGRAKILDFGLARPEKPRADQELTAADLIPGTVPYMSPEQAEGQELGCSTDLFSLGTVLFELLTGTNPFRAQSFVETLRRVAAASVPRMAEYGAEIPEELEALVARMLRRDPAQRPSAKEVAAQLRALRVGADSEGGSVPTRAPDDHRANTSRPFGTTVAPPQTQYARSGDLHIACQVFGDGPVNLVIVPGFISNVDNSWACPEHARWLDGFSRFARVAIFDKRGTGLSDRVSNLPGMDERMEDVGAVMDAAGFETAGILGISEGGSLASLFAASYPHRCHGLILHGAFARFTSWFETEEALEGLFEYIRSDWGSGNSLPGFAPSMAGDPEFQRWWGRFERLGANPGSAIALMRMNSRIDISGILPAIQAPTLVVHRAEDVLIDPKASHFLAENIPHAQLLTSPGSDHLPWVGDSVEAETKAVRDFLLESPALDVVEKVLATVLAIKLDRNSTEGSGTDSNVRFQVARYRGSAIKPYDQGYLSTFDGPARAIHCAREIVASNARARIGVHTGEISVGDSSVEGVAVDLAARIAELAEAGQVVVSRTVTDLVAGSGIAFTNVGDHNLAGVPEDWRLYRVG